MACLTVIALKPDPGEICIFEGFNPYFTILVDNEGNPLWDFNPYDCPTDYPPPIISCDEVCSIPTLGTWGLVVLTLLLLVTAKIRFGPQ